MGEGEGEGGGAFLVKRISRTTSDEVGSSKAAIAAEAFMSNAGLIGFIDETHQLLRKRHAEEPRGLEIDGDLESLDRHGVERQ